MAGSAVGSTGAVVDGHPVGSTEAEACVAEGEDPVKAELEALRTRLAAASDDQSILLPTPFRFGSHLGDLASAARPFLLEPRALFVAWSGVITLAYTGWPPQAVSLKARLEDELGALLMPEQPGSKWPKTTLGALRDGRTLDLQELERLVAVLDNHTSKLCGSDWRAEVQELDLTVFKCTGHERLFDRLVLPLRAGSADAAPPDESARAGTEKVLAEGVDLPAYLPMVQRESNHESKYRNFWAGVSLVVFAQPPEEWLAALRSGVEEALPGAYAWLQPRSLHCTLRGIF